MKLNKRGKKSGKNSLIVTGEFNKIWIKSDYSGRLLDPGPGWEKYTIEIEKILNKKIDLDMQGIEVYYDGAMYIVPLGTKFYMKNES
jgi:hypothetical protein